MIRQPPLLIVIYVNCILVTFISIANILFFLFHIHVKLISYKHTYYNKMCMNYNFYK